MVVGLVGVEIYRVRLLAGLEVAYGGKVVGVTSRHVSRKGRRSLTHAARSVDDLAGSRTLSGPRDAKLDVEVKLRAPPVPMGRVVHDGCDWPPRNAATMVSWRESVQKESLSELEVTTVMKAGTIDW